MVVSYSSLVAFMFCCWDEDWCDRHLFWSANCRWTKEAIAYKGKEREKTGLQSINPETHSHWYHLCQNSRKQKETKDQRGKNVLWRSLVTVCTLDREKNLIWGAKWVKDSQWLLWCSWSSLLHCPNCFSRASQQPRLKKKCWFYWGAST